MEETMLLPRTVQGGLGTAIGGVIEVVPGSTIEFFIGGDGVHGNTSTQAYQVKEEPIHLV